MEVSQYLFGFEFHSLCIHCPGAEWSIIRYEYQERCNLCPGAIYRISSAPTNVRYFYTCPLCTPHAFAEVDHPEKYATRYYLRYKEDV